ncbi:type-F conjugative transfer system pilin assembly protein TrbC [Shewanella sp. YLB-07]|uniref:type-F conjugative transfer system pilin assembly protein TrbC n=1 Tax=Shewanella sp. YLB-07 TaxID=2601268 RepID=UPI001D15212D|nr:type-F conjugative transfer system pilin assembly protein TrbC [Shewanella sp. YLB-07]
MKPREMKQAGIKQTQARRATMTHHLSTFPVDKWSIFKQINPLMAIGLIALSCWLSPTLTAQPQAAHDQPDTLQALSQHEQQVLRHAAPVMGIDTFGLMEKARAFEADTKRALHTALSPILDKARQTNSAADATGIMVFASLSLPRTSLTQLLMQSADLQVPIIIRGVQPQGFTATLKQMNGLINYQGQAINSGFAINPQWFSQFGITQVPAFVAIKPGRCQAKQPCFADDFDVLYGNVSLYDALTLLSQHGSVADVAANALARRELTRRSP